MRCEGRDNIMLPWYHDNHISIITQFFIQWSGNEMKFYGWSSQEVIIKGKGMDLYTSLLRGGPAEWERFVSLCLYVM